MDRPPGAVAAYGRQHRTGADALAFAERAERALDRDDLDGCADALRDGVACVVAMDADLDGDVLWRALRSLQELVDAACRSLESEGPDARSAGRRAVRAIRSHVNRLDPSAA